MFRELLNIGPSMSLAGRLKRLMEQPLALRLPEAHADTATVHSMFGALDTSMPPEREQRKDEIDCVSSVSSDPLLIMHRPTMGKGNRNIFLWVHLSARSCPLDPRWHTAPAEGIARAFLPLLQTLTFCVLRPFLVGRFN